MNEYLIYALIAVGIFTAYMAIVNLLRGDRAKARLKTATDDLYGIDDDERPPAFAAFAGGMLSMIGVDTRSQKELHTLLLQAGLRSPHAVAYFLFFKRFVQPVMLAVGAYFFLRLILASGNMETLDKLFNLLSSLLLITLGMFGSTIYVSNRKQRRQQKLLWSFPEALDLLLVCIESGLGLDAALSRVCAEMRKTHPEITQEFDRTRMELTMMSDRGQALQNMAERTEIVPFKSLVAALIQTEKFGTSLLDTLRVLSEDQRITRLFNAENRAARIPVLITIPLIFCILPALVIVILGPPIIKVSMQGGLLGRAAD